MEKRDADAPEARSPYRSGPRPPEYRVVWIERGRDDAKESLKLNILAAEGFRFLSCSGGVGEYQALVIMVREGSGT
jgi:hypothetical protein